MKNVNAQEKAIALSNFRTAREMLCIKMGWEQEFQHYIRKHDVDASQETVKEFKRKLTRLLAYNYDVHRCPNPSFFPSLLPKEHPNSSPVRFPPEYKQTNQNQELEET